MATDLSIRPASEFSVEQGKHKLANLVFNAEDLDASLVTPNDREAMQIDEELRQNRGEEPNANPTGLKQNILRLDAYIDSEGNFVSVSSHKARIVSKLIC